MGYELAVPVSGAAIGRRAVAQAFGYVAYMLVIAAPAALALSLTSSVPAWLFLAAIVLGLGLIVALSLGADDLRVRTLRALLTAFALTEGVFWAFVSQRADAEMLLVAALVAGMLFGVSSIYGLRTRRDLSAWGPFLFCVLAGLLLAWVGVILTGAQPLVLVLCAVGIVLFSAYTAHDVQTVRAPAADCSCDDELERLTLLCAISLYLDLANLVVDVLNVTRSLSEGTMHAGLNVLGSVGDALSALLSGLGDVVGAIVGGFFDAIGAFGW